MNRIIYTLVCALLLLSGPAHCATGTLFIVGGGQRPDYLMGKFLSLAGGHRARILILPMASEEPLERARNFKNQLVNLGAQNVDYVIVSSATADLPENLQKLRESDAVFITGGDQNLFMAAVTGTKFLAQLKKLYAEGATIGGTSAGAAVMSEVMITGGDLSVSSAPEKGSDFAWLRSNMVETAQGLGFIYTAILDQHFLKKGRFARLISAVLDHPQLFGIGVDESTAAIIGPDGNVEVLGESSVVIVDARTVDVKTAARGIYSGSALKLHILASGDSFSLATGKFRRPAVF